MRRLPRPRQLCGTHAAATQLRWHRSHQHQGGGESSNLTWDTVKRMRDVTRMKIVLKGIVTADDAALAVQNGMDGILVSNHGGRGGGNGRSPIPPPPGNITAMKGQIPVFVDSGFRRGTDVV